MATIYISSTFDDLKEYRDKSIAALLESGHRPKCMENYAATNHSPLKKCLEDVKNCDYYVGIFAWRYGYIPTSEDNPAQKSITELEYRQACKMDKPLFIFLLHDDAPWHRKFMDDHNSKDRDKGKRIIELRNELKEKRVIRFFKTPEELATQVTAAVSDWMTNEIEQKQQYSESKNLREIVLNPEYIESLNKSLKLAQEMKNNRLLSENQLEHFNQIKKKSQAVFELSNRIKELAQEAHSFVSEIRDQLDQERQNIVKEISQNEHKSIGANRLETWERLDKIIGKFEREIERGKKVSQWIENQHHDLVKDGIQSSLQSLEDRLGQKLYNTEQYNNLKLEITQYLRRIAYSVSLGRTNLLDNANGLDRFPKILYKTFFEYIKVRKVQVSSILSKSEKDLLTFYINHLIDHVFVEF